MVERVHVRQLGLQEWALLRSLRLDALRESPEQFGEKLSEAQQRSEQGWVGQVEYRGSATYVAEVADRSVGLVFALHDREDTSIGRLGGMWVAPEARRGGVGSSRSSSELCRALSAW